MLKRYQTMSLAVILALSSVHGIVHAQEKPFATSNLNDSVKERRIGDGTNADKPFLRIYGREAVMAEAQSGVIDNKTVVFVAPEHTGRTAVIEAMIIDQEFILETDKSAQQRVYHKFEMKEALERYSDLLRQNQQQNGSLDLKLNLDDTQLRAQQQAATASLSEALHQIEKLNLESKKSGVTHALIVHINGLTPGFEGEKASGGFFDVIKIAMQKEIPMMIEVTPELWDISFGKIHGIDQIAKRVDVGVLPEDKVRIAVVDQLRWVLSKQTNELAKKIEFPQLAIEEIVRMVQVKGSADVIHVADTLIKELILEKLMVEQREVAILKRQMDNLDHEIRVTKDREALKKLNLERLEILFKMKSFESGKLDIKDLSNIKETLARPAERGLVAGTIEKFTSLLPFGGEKKAAPAPEALVNLTWDDVVPKDEIGKSQLVKRVNDFVERIQALREPTVAVSTIQQIAVKKLGVKESQLKFDPKNIKANLRSYLDKRVIGMSELKTTLVGDLVRRLEEGPDPAKPNKAITNFSVAGPTGVGKSELLRSIADGTGMAVVRLNGNELMDAFAKTAITKSPPGYIGSDKKVALEMIADNPNGKFLLWIDEIDKLPIQTLQTLMEAMDAGELKLTDGRVIHFKNTMIGSTSNWAPEIFSIKYQSAEWQKLMSDLQISEKDLAGKNYQKIMQKVLIEYLVKVGHQKIDDHNRATRVKYPRELLARFSDFYIVHQLTSYEARRVIVKTLLELQQNYRNRGIRLMYSADLVYQIRDTFDKELNGRGIESAIRDLQRLTKDAVDQFIEKNKLSKSAFNENYVVVVDAEVVKGKAFVAVNNSGEPTLGLTRNGVSIDVKQEIRREASPATVRILERNIFEEVSKQVMAEAESLKQDSRSSMFYRNKQSPGLAAPSALDKVAAGGEQSSFLTERAIEKLRMRFKAR